MPARVLYIHHGRGIGGASLSLLYTIQGLDPERYQAEVLLLCRSSAKELYEKNGIPTRVADRWPHFQHTISNWTPFYRPFRILYLFLSFYVTATRYARQVLLEEKPDLVHLNSYHGIAWARAAHRLGIPVISHIREPMPTGYFGLRKSFIRRQLALSEAEIIAISHHNAGLVNLPERTRVIYNFVDHRRFSHEEAPQSESENGKSESQVIFLGGANTIKGFETLVDSLPMLREGTTVIFAGDYPEGGRVSRILLRKRYQALVALKRAKNATIIGSRTDIAEWLRNADILVFPSTIPHFARPVAEAQLMGKAVVASNVEGMEEQVVDGEDGILVTPNRPADLAAAINRLIDDPELRRRLGERGRERANRNYRQDKNVEAIQALYSELLARRQG